MFKQDNNGANNGTNNGSIYGNFRERLRNIRLLRIKKLKASKTSNVDSKKDTVHNQVINNDVFVSEVVKEIRATSNERTCGRSVVGSLSGTKSKDNVGETTLNMVISTNNKDRVSTNNKDRVSTNNEDTRLEEIVSNIRQNKPQIKRPKRVGYVYNSSKRDLSDLSKEERKELLDTLGAEIIDKIKEGFEEKLDELEVLESELYLLNLQQSSEVELKKVREIKKRINELIDRINELIGQYNLYKDNYYIDNVIGLDDNILVDDIIDYRTLLDSFDDEKEFVKEYKALDEFKALYDNLVSVRDETEKIQEANEKKIEELDIRDKKYDEIKLGMVKALNIDYKCSYEMERQNEYFDELMSKISRIDRHEYVTSHLRGVGNLIGQSLRYMGLMLASPFAGLIPGISIQTIATRRMLANAYRHLHYEDVNHVYYEAIDYDSELNHHLTDVNYAEALVDDALKDVDRLRDEFMRIYDSNIPGYMDTLKDIDKIEKKLLRNQNKVAIVKKNLKVSKKLNESKLKRVRELNETEQRRVA